MADLLLLLAPLLNLLGIFQKERHYQSDKTDAALLAIQKALIETKKYAEVSSDRKVSNREKEYELSQLWAEASVKARHASEDLANRLNDKSLLWSATFEWSREEILAKRIDFDSIEGTIRELLSHS